MAGLAASRMSGGSELNVAGPACEKARAPSLVRSRGITYLLLEADRRPVCVAELLDDVCEICRAYASVYSVQDCA